MGGEDDEESANHGNQGRRVDAQVREDGSDTKTIYVNQISRAGVHAEYHLSGEL